MIKITPEKLVEIGEKIFTAQGVSEETSSFLVKTLVEANLTGHDSHGVHYYPIYSNRIKQGHIDVKADPKIIKETPTSAFIDGKWGIGQHIAKKVSEIAVEKAKKQMVSVVGAYNCNHIGRIGYYTDWVASQGMIGIMFVNVGGPNVSVHNGLKRAFGTNPFSVSTPTKGETPFLVDYATSMVAVGKVSVARAKHAKIPEHWGRDKYGRVTDDPADIFDEGWLLPFGEHKGYGLQLAAEILGAILTGSRSGQDPPTDPPSPNGVLMIAVNPEAFIGLEKFSEKTTQVLEKVKKIEPVSGEKVYIPGEPEKFTKEERIKDGIPIPDDTWTRILSLCDELGIDLEIS